MKISTNVDVYYIHDPNKSFSIMQHNSGAYLWRLQLPQNFKKRFKKHPNMGIFRRDKEIPTHDAHLFAGNA